MTAIDTRFLTVHPRTTLWWAQRETCKRCAFLIEPPMKTKSQGGGMVCRGASNKADTTCISAREPGMPCGPDATLFSPRGEA